VKVRLDQALVQRGLVASRSQAESYIRLGKVLIREDSRAYHSDPGLDPGEESYEQSADSSESKIPQNDKKESWRQITKPGYFVSENTEIKLDQAEQFVSRAGLKLASVADKLGLDFTDKIVLDIGSSTGGFTQFALSRGARKVIAVDVGTDQLHPSLSGDQRIELHEKTDIRDFYLDTTGNSTDLPRKHRTGVGLSLQATARSSSPRPSPMAQPCAAKSIKFPDLILADVSFISLREILPHVAQHLAGPKTRVVAMLKPQFETGARAKNAGVIKNDTERRKVLKEFETWVKQYFLIQAKADSAVAGMHGNHERFYCLLPLARSVR